MAGILFFCVFSVSVLNTNRARADGTTPAPGHTPTPGPTPAWESRNLGGWMFSVMPGAQLSFGSVFLSNFSALTLCLRAVTEKGWLMEDELLLTFGERPAVSIAKYYASNKDYMLQVAGSTLRFNKPAMTAVLEVDSVWKSRCLTWDSGSGLAQLWFDGMMSVRKGLSRGTVFSGQAELTMPQFEGQVSDVYMWDSVLGVRQLHRFLDGRSAPPRGRVLDWTQMRFRTSGYVLLEAAYPKRLRADPAERNKRRRMMTLNKQQRQEV